MSKKLAFSSLLLGLSLFSSFYLSEEAIATNISESENNNSIVSSLKKDQRDDNIRIQFRNELIDLSNNLNQNAFLNGDIGATEVFPFPNTTIADIRHSPFARVNDDMVLQNGNTLAAHNALLTNMTDIDLVMSTASFTYTQSDRVTTTTTHATGVSMTTNAEMNFPFINGGMSMTVGYDFSHTNSVESTVEKVWAVPSQTIPVPAGRSFNVSWVLETGVATGTTNLTSSVSALVPYKRLGSNGPLLPMETGAAVFEYDRLIAALPGTQFRWSHRDNWEPFNDETALRKWGTARYRAQFGTKLRMLVTDANSPRSSPVVIQEILMDVTPKVVE
ncbi:ETX/MTX2 family pore-forming toxin [Enterococcus sp. 5H]|uniref:ETX/MTX2 family pore-forming toxin n=1 Tax=Enterococcus sp. 5H TaxID=1229490 RepID=UPI002303795C|nr:ETX/MTX2 family pore-forming toxin [Enterococcus sp. 5H]MDA9472438.1 epsilon toxin [Enterococcus sp. 5H]